jgi:hypothetical protein
MSHAHVELYLLQGLYVPCPCGTLFIAGAICPMPMWNFIYCRGYMSHAHGHILPFLILLISIFINTYFVILKNKLILYNASCIISVK